MSRVSSLAHSYERHVSAPWQEGIAGGQRVVFVVYDKTDELKLRAHVAEFELATRNAGHDWHLIDITDAFPRWMASQRYKDAYFECPDDLDGYQVGEVKEFTQSLIQDVKADLEQNAHPSQVTALLGVGALFGVSHVSTLVNGIANAVPGRLLVFFPGEYEHNAYRLLDARDGWNYLDDGIVCIPTIRGEKPAAERLLSLLQAAYGDDWAAQTLSQLLAESGARGKGLEWWLRERFFEQHCKLFQHRPFIWHIWDGLKDGFGALVNYHPLDRKTLETLVYTYLGDWIGLQERAVNDGIDGAEIRLTAAQDLKRRLELILEGEQPYDIFVRWKALEQQAIGWAPDLNDGVRLNIRPFVTAQVLRHNKKPKLNIHWKKDRGKDVGSAPWYRLGLEYGGKEGDRINDHHLSLAEKRAAREVAGE